jgi:hypothetical protein
MMMMMIKQSTFCCICSDGAAVVDSSGGHTSGTVGLPRVHELSADIKSQRMPKTIRVLGLLLMLAPLAA